jgi:site-specific recombinase XerD
LAAISNRIKFKDVPNPMGSPLVKAAKKAVKRLAKPTKQKQPLTAELRTKIVQQADLDDFSELRDVFLITLLFAALLRESEAVALQANDVWVEEFKMAEGKRARALCVLVRQSKTDQERKQHSIIVGELPGNAACPVALFEKYRQLRRGTAATLFHQTGSDSPLGATRPNLVMKQWVEAVGEDPTEYGSHSGRRGGATAAAEAGIETRLIMKHGNWRSDAVFVYIVDSVKTKLTVSQAILGVPEAQRNGVDG